MTSFRLAVLAGDGIGPEVVAEAVKVLRAVEAATDHTFVLTEDVVGGAAIDAYGTAIRKETIALAKRLRRSSASSSRLNKSADPWMTVKRLLKSCAIPPVN